MRQIRADVKRLGGVRFDRKQIDAYRVGAEVVLVDVGAHGYHHVVPAPMGTYQLVHVRITDRQPTRRHIQVTGVEHASLFLWVCLDQETNLDLCLSEFDVPLERIHVLRVPNQDDESVWRCGHG